MFTPGPKRKWTPFARAKGRSEEHTSELQSRSDLVCRLLLEKKKKTKKHYNQQNQDMSTIRTCIRLIYKKVRSEGKSVYYHRTRVDFGIVTKIGDCILLIKHE